MKKTNVLGIMLICSMFLFTALNITNAQHAMTVKQEMSHSASMSELTEVDYKGSKVSYFGSKKVSTDRLLIEAKLVDIADRRFESKWVQKDAQGISEEYTLDGVFMTPGATPNIGREEIKQAFTTILQNVDRVQFYQDELQFLGDLDVAFQRCHMKGYKDGQKEPISEASYVILWKKVDGNWLIHYDMFNSDK